MISSSKKAIKRIIGLIACVAVAAGSLAAVTPVASSAEMSLQADAPEGLTQALKYAAPVVDTTDVGYHIQRTMRLLETSTKENPNTVRIAFCGQSITDQANNTWPAAIMAYLRAKYPNANIESMNFGIGGYNTSLMQKIYQNDISSFYPDLVFFYDYGDLGLYRSIIKWIRDNSVAEIIVQGYHVDNGNYATDKSDADLKEVAAAVDCEFADVRTYWRKYLNDNNLNYKEVLSDGEVHLNDQGQSLMYELIKQFLVYKPVEDAFGEFDDQMTTYQSGKDFQWKNGKASLTFTGNRAEIITNSAPASGVKADVLINGKKPSTYLSMYNNTRYSNLTSHVYASYYNQISFLKPVTPQKWVMSFDSDTSYTLIGEISGNVGSGSISSEFVTNDGSMGFYPNFWYNSVNGSKPGGTELEFETTFNGADQVSFTGLEKVASNLPKKTNTITLTLSDTSAAPDISIKVYTPGFLYSKKAQIDGELKAGATKVTGTVMADSTACVAIGESVHKAKAGSDGKFEINLPAIAGNSLVDVYYEYDGHKSQPMRFATGEGDKVLPKLSKVNGGLTSASKKISGKAAAYDEIMIENGSKTFIGYADASGKFSVKVSKLVPGKAKVTALANGVSSKAKTVNVLPKAPVVKAVAKTGVISGKADGSAKITISNGKKKIKVCKAKKGGAFKVKAKGKFKKGAKLTVVAAVGKLRSKAVTVKAK